MLKLKEDKIYNIMVSSIIVKINFGQKVKDSRGQSIDRKKKVDINHPMPMKLSHALRILSENDLFEEF